MIHKLTQYNKQWLQAYSSEINAMYRVRHIKPSINPCFLTLENQLVIWDLRENRERCIKQKKNHNVSRDFCSHNTYKIHCIFSLTLPVYKIHCIF